MKKHDITLVNKVKSFCRIANGAEYSLVGSGSGAERILDIISDFGLPAPDTVHDDFNIGKKLAEHVVRPTSEIIEDIRILFIASEQFAEQIKSRLATSLGDRYQRLFIVTLADLNSVTNIVNSRYPVIIHSLPKSGTFYVRENLSRLLNVQSDPLVEGFWPNHYIKADRLSQLVQRNGFFTHHLSDNAWNRKLFKKAGVKKLMVHVRDPRQAVLSFIHHLDKSYAEDAIDSYALRPSLEGYFTASMEEKIDYQLEHFLRNYCADLEGFLELSEEDFIEVKFITFTKMKNQPAEFFADIYAFFEVQQNIEKDLAELSLLNKDSKVQFRKGLEEEWREVFTASQIEVANKILKPHLRSLFDWKD